MKYTEQEVQYLIDNYANNRTIEIAKHLNRPVTSIYEKANKLGLRKSLEVIQLEARLSAVRNIDKISKSWFKKGSEPKNKGKKQTDYMSAEAIEKVKATQFKKGNKPHNTKFDGYLSVRRTKGINYIYIRISEAKHQLYHRYIWEQHYKEKLTSKDNIIFINGNQTDVRIENLKKVSHAELLEINALRNKPKEYREVFSAIKKLNNKIKKLEKK